MDHYEKQLQAITEIVHDCGKIMLRATDIDRKIHAKEGRGNFVTEYDCAVQAALRERLLALVPGAAFLAEEDDADKCDIHTGYSFIVDPIDGTANFTRGYKMSCISVALAKEGYPVAGVVYNPYTDETFTACKGGGACLNGEPIRVSDRDLAQGIVMFGTAPYSTELSQKSFETAFRYFSRAQDLRRSGSAAYDMCCLACGRAEFFFEWILCPWDYAAASVIIEEAGGFVSDLAGNPVSFDHRQPVAARAAKVELLL